MTVLKYWWYLNYKNGRSSQKETSKEHVTSPIKVRIISRYYPIQVNQTEFWSVQINNLYTVISEGKGIFYNSQITTKRSNTISWPAQGFTCNVPRKKSHFYLSYGNTARVRRTLK